jgi:hypothetical protein
MDGLPSIKSPEVPGNDSKVRKFANWSPFWFILVLALGQTRSEVFWSLDV